MPALGWGKHPRPPALWERFNRLRFRLATPIPVPLLQVRAFRAAPGSTELLAERLAAAVRLLQSVTPLRLAYLRRDLPFILVAFGPCAGQCLDRVGICLLNTDDVLCQELSVEVLALVLVHEGTHARLARLGFENEGKHRARIERLCRLAAVTVGTRLPGAEEYVAWLQEMELSHESFADDEYWTDAALMQRVNERVRARGWAAVVGSWVARILVLLERAIQKRAA